jgi:cytochrome c peroxidase
MYTANNYQPYLLLTATLISLSTPLIAAQSFKTKQALGSALYFDVNLSKNRNQSCATCHAPTNGFIDNRKNSLSGAVSLGSDEKSFGDRNAPTASYASFIPVFHLAKNGNYTGGQFHDGRASTLQDQAAGPPLNPAEMAMEDQQAVLERLLENPVYKISFSALFNSSVLDDPKTAYQAMTQSIASFEKSDFFSPFDSKYDRYLKGEYQLSEAEKLGETIFFSQQFSNCNACHQLKKLPAQTGETFSNYEFHNIGVPINTAVRNANGKGLQFIDHGLLENPLITDRQHDGKFKVPTLRNIAVTGPYMHNGVFQELRTVVLFYDKYNSRKASRKINPETAVNWQLPEVKETISLSELTKGKALSDKRVDALVAFMKTLTDKKFEYLLDK